MYNAGHQLTPIHTLLAVGLESLPLLLGFLAKLTLWLVCPLFYRGKGRGGGRKESFLISMSFLAQSKHLINFKDISLQTLLMQPE